MGTSLTGLTPATTYDALIKVGDNGPLSATAKYLSDGLGNDSVLSLSTTNVGIGTSTPTYKLNVITDAVSGRQDLTNINRTLGNLVTFTNPQYSIDASVGLLLRVFPQSDARQGAGIIASGGNLNGETDLSLFVSSGLASSTSFSALYIKGENGNVGIGTTTPSNFGKLGIQATNASTKSGIGIGVFSNGTNASPYTNAMIEAFTSSGVAGSGMYSINTYSDNSRNEIAFRTSSTSGTIAERIRITQDGLTFNGDTAAANALDDYEEGTWTMGIAFGNASVGVTYNFRGATYTKIGRQVTVNGYMVLSSKGSSTGSATITGLPFTVGGLTGNYTSVCLRLSAVSFVGQFQGNSDISSTTISFNQISEIGTISNMDDTNFANNSAIMVNMTYFV